MFRNVDGANEYVTLQAPWKLARDPGAAAALDETLATLARKLAIQTVLLAPFMPAKAQAVWEQLGGPGAVADSASAASGAARPERLDGDEGRATLPARGARPRHDSLHCKSV